MVTYTDVTLPTFAELFCDYSIKDLLFFRIGKQIITWGATRFFPFDDLPARVPVSTATGLGKLRQLRGYCVQDDCSRWGSLPLWHSPKSRMGISPTFHASPWRKSGSDSRVMLFRAILIFLLAGFTRNTCRRAPSLSPRRRCLESMPGRAPLLADVAGSGAAVSWFANGYWEQPDVKFHVSGVVHLQR